MGCIDIKDNLPGDAYCMQAKICTTIYAHSDFNYSNVNMKKPTHKNVKFKKCHLYQQPASNWELRHNCEMLPSVIENVGTILPSYRSYWISGLGVTMITC